MNGPQPGAHARQADSALLASEKQNYAPATASDFAIRCGRFLYTHNPFYIASAWLVFSGLRASFPVGSGQFDAWALTLCLMGYTLLLALTALLVIRLGRVWDDARSILIMVVLMFLGISVTFDGRLANRPDETAWYYVFGWIFAAGVSEILLHSVRLRLGLLYRVPFHMLLALQFLYPLVLAPRLVTPHDPVLGWQLLGFASVGAVIFLCLIPAVRRGPAYVAGNGSPWQWPLYPWVLFGTLVFCVSLRAYYLCRSLHFVGAENSIFGLYFLVPLGWALCVLLLEGGLAAGSRRGVGRALFLAPLLVLMTFFGPIADPVYQRFLVQFEATLGASPTVATLWMVTGFYLFASVRGVAVARYPMAITLVGLALIGARFDWTRVDPVPLAMAGAWLILAGMRFRLSVDVVAGLCTAWASVAVAGHGTWFHDVRALLPIHLLLLLLLAAGYWYRDRTGGYVRKAAVVLAVLLASNAAWAEAPIGGDVPGWARMLYPFAMTLVIAAYSRVTGDAWLYTGAVASAVVGSAVYLGRMYTLLQHRVAGLNELTWGLLFFLVAAVVSTLKSGLWPSWTRLTSHWRR